MLAQSFQNSPPTSVKRDNGAKILLKVAHTVVHLQSVEKVMDVPVPATMPAAKKTARSKVREGQASLGPSPQSPLQFILKRGRGRLIRCRFIISPGREGPPLLAALLIIWWQKEGR